MTSKVKAAHDLVNSLRSEGYSVGIDSDDVVEDFDEHKQQAIEMLEGDDVAGFFLVVDREMNADYSTSVIVRDSTVWGLCQIQMLGAHFRTVLDALPLNTTDLVDAIVDEAISIEDDDHDVEG